MILSTSAITAISIDRPVIVYDSTSASEDSLQTKSLQPLCLNCYTGSVSVQMQRSQQAQKNVTYKHTHIRLFRIVYLSL